MASFTERYHEYTKYNPQTIDKLGKVVWEEQPRQFKEFTNEESISLIPYLSFLKEDSKNTAWGQIHLNEGEKITDLSFLARTLYFTCGITSLMQTGEEVFYLRANPSAGGLYPVEVFLVISPNSEIPEGIYAFHPMQLTLTPVRKEGAWDEMRDVLFRNPDFEDCQSLLIFTGLFSRGEWRYKERTYRRMLLDSGHAAENTRLFSEFNQIDTSWFGGFHDDILSDLLLLDEEDEVPLAVLGLKPTFKNTLTHPQAGPPPVQSIVRVKNLTGSMQKRQNLVERINEPNLKINAQPSTRYIADDSNYTKSCNLIPRNIRDRRSCRKFKNETFPKAWLDEALNFSFNHLQGRLSGDFLKTRLIINNCEGYDNGLYEYQSDGNLFLLDSTPPDLNKFHDACLGQPLATESSVQLFFYADLNLATASMGDRVYRYLCQDAGRIGERLNIFVSNTPMGTTGVGGYFDDLCNELLKIDSTQAILYITTLGIDAHT